MGGCSKNFGISNHFLKQFFDTAGLASWGHYVVKYTPNKTHRTYKGTLHICELVASIFWISHRLDKNYNFRLELGEGEVLI